MTIVKTTISRVNAVFYVHDKELTRVHDPHPLDFRYLDDYIIDVEEAGQISTITGDTEIIPGIKVIHPPSHTGGGLSVIVETAKGRAVITGCCAIMENFNPPKEITAMEMDVIPPVIHVDAYDILC